MSYMMPTAQNQVDLTPFQVPHKLLLGAGPVNCSPRVLNALAMQPLGPVDKDTLLIIDDVREKLKQVFFTKNKLTLAQQTSGSGGLETVLTNIVEPGEKIIVAIGGVWGERVAKMAETHKIEVVRLNVEAGGVYKLKDLEVEIEKHRPVLLFITHGESSTGAVQSLDGLADACHKYNCLLAVDAIISLASEPLFVDDWKLDIVVGATQKAIGAPPGFSLLTFSPQAEKIIMNRKSPVPFYFDLKGLAYCWRCFDDKNGYYYTYSTNMLAALREALAEKLEEGMENVWARHRLVNERITSNLEKIGIKQFIKNPEHRLHSVCTYTLPEDIEWTSLLDHLYEDHQMSISFGIGPTANKVIRLGLMGVNASIGMADHVAAKLKEGMEYCRKNRVKAVTITDGMF